MPGSLILSQHETATLSLNAEDQVFSEPWEAQAFALTVHLHERGLFDWSEWAEYLSQEIAATESSNQPYYVSWLKALEKILADKSVASADAVSEVSQAWQRAAHATPHGSPILLENDPDREG